MKINFEDYTILKMIERKEYFSVYSLRKNFNSLTGLGLAFSSFYRKIRYLKKEKLIVTQPLRLTEKGKKRLEKMEERLLEILTFLSCGV